MSACGNHFSLLQVLTLRAPESTLTQKDVEERWKEVESKYTENTGTGTEDAALFVDLLRGMLQVRPEDRKGLAVSREHPWFNIVCKSGSMESVVDSANGANGA